MTAGIDYGMGTTNIDAETGIRFGVIPSNDMMPEAFDDIASNGISDQRRAINRPITMPPSKHWPTSSAGMAR